jgi:predicted dinucleotide-binding enzyme
MTPEKYDPNSKNVIVLIGAGQIGHAIAPRVGIGKHILLADMRLDNAKAAAKRERNPFRVAFIINGGCR